MRKERLRAIHSPLQEELDRIADDIVECLDADMALLSLTNDALLVSLGMSGSVGRSKGMRHHIPENLVCFDTIVSGEPLILTNARDHHRASTTPFVLDGTVQGYIGVPIRNAELGAIGAVCGITSTPRNWSASDLQYLRAVSLSVENLILREMHRLESENACNLASEYDNIIAAFAIVRAEPTSIHDEAGNLVFANRALTDNVSDAELQGEAIVSALRQRDKDTVIDYTSAAGIRYAVSRQRTASGYSVCQWSPRSHRLH